MGGTPGYFLAFCRFGEFSSWEASKDGKGDGGGWRRKGGRGREGGGGRESGNGQEEGPEDFSVLEKRG